MNATQTAPRTIETVATEIKDLKKGDRVLHYGSVFLITSDVRWFQHAAGGLCPVCDCKRVEVVQHQGYADGLLADYDAFQGLWKVALVKN